MNVAPGNLARIVGSMNIVRVVRAPATWEGARVLRPAWHCVALCTFPTECGHVATPGDKVTICDAILRPLHDGDGVDESLSWAALPNKPQEVAA